MVKDKITTLYSPYSCIRLARKFSLDECDNIDNRLHMFKNGNWRVNYQPFGYEIILDVPAFSPADLINLLIIRNIKIDVRFNTKFIGIDLDQSFKVPNIIDTLHNAFYKTIILNLPDISKHTFKEFLD